MAKIVILSPPLAGLKEIFGETNHVGVSGDPSEHFLIAIN